jgi:lysophospholipase L1-like esterase
MKLLVFGHSNSDGSRLPDPEEAWLWLLKRMLAERGLEFEVVHRLLFAGPAAAQRLEDELEREQPDVVVLATSSYGVAVRLVSNRVRERWGDRAANLARRGELYFARHPYERSSIRSNILQPARRIARRVLGTRPSHSEGQLAGYYAQCMRILAQHEEIQTIVLTGVGYGPAVERFNPNWQRTQDAVYAELEAEALSHGFPWVPHEELLGGRTAKLKYFFADGIHTNAASHRVAAEAILPLIVDGHGILER